MILDQVLWIDAVIKITFGLLLVLVPAPVALLLGLPKPDQLLLARLLGSLLLGVGLAIILEGSERGSTGLGPGGAFAINGVGTLMLALSGTVLAGGTARRGRLALLTAAVVLGLIGLVELAYA